MIIPTFCSWGLSPFPSGGVNGSRSNGLDENNMTMTKKTVTKDVTPATYGRRSA
jgi:hypothetical protein